jgi:hypothetical protein
VEQTAVNASPPRVCKKSIQFRDHWLGTAWHRCHRNRRVGLPRLLSRMGLSMIKQPSKITQMPKKNR